MFNWTYYWFLKAAVVSYRFNGLKEFSYKPTFKTVKRPPPPQKKIRWACQILFIYYKLIKYTTNNIVKNVNYFIYFVRFWKLMLISFRFIGGAQHECLPPLYLKTRLVTLFVMGSYLVRYGLLVLVVKILKHDHWWQCMKLCIKRRKVYKCSFILLKHSILFFWVDVSDVILIFYTILFITIYLFFHSCFCVRF